MNKIRWLYIVVFVSVLIALPFYAETVYTTKQFGYTLEWFKKLRIPYHMYQRLPCSASIKLSTMRFTATYVHPGEKALRAIDLQPIDLKAETKRDDDGEQYLMLNVEHLLTDPENGEFFGLTVDYSLDPERREKCALDYYPSRF
jgi:hypothetical protein